MPLLKSKKAFRFSDYDAIGFDLDHTLARYKLHQLGQMVYEIVAKFLVREKDYCPFHMLQHLDLSFVARGLILDYKKGNILKISNKGRIVKAAHGSKFMKNEEIQKYYPNNHWDLIDRYIINPFDIRKPQNADKIRALHDFFDIVNSLLFARMVDSVVSKEGKQKEYKVFQDLHEGMLHVFQRSNFYKNGGFYYNLKHHSSAYYYRTNEQVLDWLRDLKASGKFLFIVTGAFAEYAILTGNTTLGKNWLEYFDMIFFYSRKQDFFGGSEEFYEHDHNFKQGKMVEFEDLKIGSQYLRGNFKQFKQFIQKYLKKDDVKVLYMGDHAILDITAPYILGGVDTVAVSEELSGERILGYTHLEKEVVTSDTWGSYFKCSDGSDTNWYEMMKKHARLFVPDLDYVANYPIDHSFYRVEF